MASTYLTRTPSGAGNGNTWTFSVWVKKSNLSTTQFLIGSSTSASDFEDIRFNANTGELSYNRYLTTKQWGFDSNTYLRDVSGWYHVVVNRNGTTMNYYLNGVLQTKTNEVTSTSTGDFNTTDELRIGGRPDTTSNTFDGSMSHVHFIDGTAYDASYFGSTDATTGEWKINTSPSVTYGTNGFFILKDGNSVTDQSGNSNNFTVGGGTLTKTEDCPSNVFATMNTLDNQIASSTFSHGNNTVQTNNSNYTWNTGTLGMSSGKYYWEVKYSANSNASMYNTIGIAERPTDGTTDVLGLQTDCANYCYYADTGKSFSKDVQAVYGNTYTVGDIVGVAVDLDNSKLYFSKNGTWQNSGVPTSGSTGTGAISIDAISITTTGVYFPASGDYGSTQNCTNQHNFGNGYFGTTAVSSAGTNASGIGIFEYDVPTGYTALSTKGLNL